ncbi:MAG: DUF115 domain-containing protein [Spirochaetaceae bacterium]|jgi:hypothetical protein|nr:DUF115 domain-containing protein [Spirochaetaceae bacterium]
MITAAQGAHALHSRYNPAGEAEKYIASLEFREIPRFLILLEPGRGYMIPVLGRKFPDAKILVIHAEAQDAPETGDLKIPPVYWTPDSGVSLERFLEQEIPDIEASAIKIVEWRPALAVYGETYRRLLAETAAVIKRLDANKRTTRAFGLRWFKNFFKILRAARRVIRQTGPAAGMPCVVAGAGPSLEESLPLVKNLKARNTLLVLGVSSSAGAFLAHDLVPDLIVTADGGGWALFHLYECLRSGDRPFGFAASLFSALPSQCADTPLLLISDGSFWQTLILQSLNLPFISLPQRGTVTATALDLAFSVTSGPVAITGMDLAHRDIRAHARPNSLEQRLEEKACRFSPAYARMFDRSYGISAGGSLSVYAEWFSRQIPSYPKRLYAIGDNHPAFKDLKQWDPPVNGISGGHSPFGIRTIPAGTELAKQGKAILLRALRAPQTSARIRRELGPLLFPDDADLSLDKLCDRISLSLKAYSGDARYG